MTKALPCGCQETISFIQGSFSASSNISCSLIGNDDFIARRDDEDEGKVVVFRGGNVEGDPCGAPTIGFLGETNGHSKFALHGFNDISSSIKVLQV